MTEKLSLTSTQVSRIIEEATRLVAADGMWGETNDFSATSIGDKRGQHVEVTASSQNLDSIATVLVEAGYQVERKTGETHHKERLPYGREALTTVPYDVLYLTLPQA